MLCGRRAPGNKPHREGDSDGPSHHVSHLAGTLAPRPECRGCRQVSSTLSVPRALDQRELRAGRSVGRRLLDRDCARFLARVRTVGPTASQPRLECSNQDEQDGEGQTEAYGGGLGNLVRPEFRILCRDLHVAGVHPTRGRVEYF